MWNGFEKLNCCTSGDTIIAFYDTSARMGKSQYMRFLWPPNRMPLDFDILSVQLSLFKVKLLNFRRKAIKLAEVNSFPDDKITAACARQ